MNYNGLISDNNTFHDNFIFDLTNELENKI